MIDKKFYPEDLRLIQDMEALKIMADPLRNQIMEALTSQPMTVNQVAVILDLESSKLYYHFNLLEKHGFIQVVETTLLGNLIEKQYWITAYNYEFAKDLLNFNVDTPEGTENIINLLLTNINATRADLRRSLYARHQQITHGAPKNPRNVLDTRDILNLPDDKAQEFHGRLQSLVEEFKQEAQSMDPDTRPTLPWALSVVFYPSFRFDPDKDYTQGA